MAKVLKDKIDRNKLGCQKIELHPNNMLCCHKLTYIHILFIIFESNHKFPEKLEFHKFTFTSLLQIDFRYFDESIDKAW